MTVATGLLTLVAVGVGAAMLTDLERDRVLSALSRTTVGKVDLNGHWMRILEWGIIPLALVFSLTRPDIARMLMEFARGN